MSDENEALFDDIREAVQASHPDMTLATWIAFGMSPWITADGATIINMPATFRDLATLVLAPPDANAQSLVRCTCNGEELLDVDYDGNVRINGEQVGTIVFNGPANVRHVNVDA